MCGSARVSSARHSLYVGIVFAACASRRESVAQGIHCMLTLFLLHVRWHESLAQGIHCMLTLFLLHVRWHESLAQGIHCMLTLFLLHVRERRKQISDSFRGFLYIAILLCSAKSLGELCGTNIVRHYCWQYIVSFLLFKTCKSR